MSYQKYAYVIFSVVQNKMIAIFSSEKRLFTYAKENNLDVYRHFLREARLKNECDFSSGLPRNMFQGDLIPVKIPMDEPCKCTIQDYLQNVAAANFCKIIQDVKT